MHEALQVGTAARVGVVDVGTGRGPESTIAAKSGYRGAPGGIEISDRARVELTQKRRQRMTGAQRPIEARTCRHIRPQPAPKVPHATGAVSGDVEDADLIACEPHLQLRIAASRHHLGIDACSRSLRNAGLNGSPTGAPEKPDNSTGPPHPSTRGHRHAARRSRRPRRARPHRPPPAPRTMYESPPESSKSLISLNAPTELKPYGRAALKPPLAPARQSRPLKMRCLAGGDPPDVPADPLTAREPIPARIAHDRVDAQQERRTPVGPHQPRPPRPLWARQTPET